MKKYHIIILLFLILAVAGVIFSKDNLSEAYRNLGDNLQRFREADIGSIIEEVKKEILAPDPLRAGGTANNVVLTEAGVLAATNAQRREYGALRFLTENEKLNAAAYAKAKDMFENQYFEHVSLSGIDPGDLVKSAGYEYIIAGENLILGNFKNEAEVVQLWMDSPGHRANILNNRFTEIGIAVVKGMYKSQMVWIGVQEFGLPLSACQQPADSLKIKIDGERSAISQLVLQIESKKSEIESTNRRSARYNGLVDEYNSLVAEYNALVQEVKSFVSQYNSQISSFNECIMGE